MPLPDELDDDCPPERMSLRPLKKSSLLLDESDPPPKRSPRKPRLVFFRCDLVASASTRSRCMLADLTVGKSKRSETSFDMSLRPLAAANTYPTISGSARGDLESSRGRITYLLLISAGTCWEHKIRSVKRMRPRRQRRPKDTRLENACLFPPGAAMPRGLSIKEYFRVQHVKTMQKKKRKEWTRCPEVGEEEQKNRNGFETKHPNAYP